MNTTKIAVFGGTGGTGKEIIIQALEKGFRVNALLRNPGKLDISHQDLHIIRGDILDADAVAETIQGTDAVLSAVGTRSVGAVTIYSQSIPHIVSGMKLHNVKRILAVGAVGMEPGRDPNIPFIARLVIRLILKKVLADMYIMQQKLEATDLEWTVMWPPQLNDGGRTGTYRTEAGRAVRAGKVISRADLAHYMVNHIDSSESAKKVAIAY